MKNIALTLLAIALFFSCSKDDVDKYTHVYIRLSNISPYKFENIVVNDVPFGDLDAGATSDYKLFDEIYSYAFIELEIDGETYTLQPIDYVGESPLESGHYTYQLNTNDTGERYTHLRQTLIED